MRRISRAAPVVLILVLTACAGSIQKDAFNGLAALKAGYISANATRDAYCIPQNPKPPICNDSLKPLQAAYDLLKDGTTTLAAYTQVATADLKAKLVALIPQFTQIGLDLVTLESRFK